MTTSATEVRRPRTSLVTLAAFGVGLPLGLDLLGLVHYGPLREVPLLARYLGHPVEGVEIVLFFCATGALLGKLWLHVSERQAVSAVVLPSWDGRPVPVSEATKLLASLNTLPRSLHDTTLVRRVSGVLDFLARRGSADDLDDQLRDLSDADAVAQENSYALIRFITWAIPILGFLGTVLGITGAISGVTPEVLEQSLSTVTNGLSLAFDATALALGLTMVAMFLTYLMDRLEQGVLASVDDFVGGHLAHRFLRGNGESAVALEALVRRQAEVWAESLEAMAHREDRQQDRLAAAMEAALSRTLEAHTTRLAKAETAMLARTAEVMEHLAAVARTVEAQQTSVARLQDAEIQLVRLQESLARNLDAVNQSGALEEAVHSLTAAVHLLTARAATPPIKRPGAAA